MEVEHAAHTNNHEPRRRRGEVTLFAPAEMKRFPVHRVRELE
jgi:hypothetical protein